MDFQTFNKNLSSVMGTTAMFRMMNKVMSPPDLAPTIWLHANWEIVLHFFCGKDDNVIKFFYGYVKDETTGFYNSIPVTQGDEAEQFLKTTIAAIANCEGDGGVINAEDVLLLT